MKAPEKIYLVEDRQKHIPMEYWYNSTTDDSKIEYTRTDAFIERAENFIYSALNDGIMGTCDIENFLKLFKKALKGE